MRNTTLILTLAALAATSCSLQLDSQYGLRWDRRVPALRHSENQSQEPLTDPHRYVEPVQIDAGTSEFVPTSNNEPNEIALYDHMVEVVREEQLPYSNIANQNHRTFSVGTVTMETELQQASTLSKTTKADPFIILLKALLTLVLGVFVLTLLAIAIIIAMIGGGGGGGGMFDPFGDGGDPGDPTIFFLFIGILVCIMLMIGIWKKSSKS